MRRLSAAVLLLLICLTACTGKASHEDTALFYYLRNEMTYGREDSVITSQERQLSADTGDLFAIMHLYLAGSQDEGLSLPLPAGTVLTSVSLENQMVLLTFSQEFSGLEGVKLTLVCACISRTVFSLTDAQSICIMAPAPEGSNPVSFTADRGTFLYYDDTTAAADPS